MSVRAVLPSELSDLLALCAQHAAYERAAWDGTDTARVRKREALRRALFDAPARLHAWIAWRGREPLGYASATAEFSTWNARDYLHMDCLFVHRDARGGGIGARLLHEVVAKARALGLNQVQWQTPEWNADAIRFYERHAAIAERKRRFVLSLD